MSLRWFAGLVLITVFSGAGAGCWAGDFETPQAIRAAIEATALGQIATTEDAHVEVAVGAIDPRIHLPRCAALAVTVPRFMAPALTARVRCDEPAWTLYVPLRVHAWGRAVVAAANLGPDTILRAADLTIARIDLLAVNGAYVTDPAQAEGKVLRANVRAGAPIPAALLTQPVIVHRGQTVVLTVRDSAVTIRANVVAMQDGRVGDSILVENPDSRKNLRATVSGAGGVELRFDEAPAVN